jgi:cytochrome b6-f complex iron-sulfur subunit
MRAMPLRVVLPAGTTCAGCTRRVALQGFAMTAASLLVGCSDGATPPPDAPPTSSHTMCGSNLCLDLADPLNAALTEVDGAVTVQVSRDTIIVVRTSQSTVIALSEICTHQGCNVRYDRVGKVFNCPCHGSRFSLAGTAIRGPASSPLRKYVTQFDESTNLLTIML